MTISYAMALKDDRMNAVKTRLDAQSTVAKLKIYTAGYGTLLSTILLQKPSFSEANGQLVLLGVPLSDNNAAASGTAALAELTDGSDNVWANGLTVGTSAADVLINSINITAGQVVTCTGGQINHAA